MKKELLVSTGRYILALTVGGALLAGLSLWTATQMQEMQTELREQEVAPIDGAQIRPERETVAYYWDTEELVARQIVKALRLNRPENTRMILDNVEQNIQFNRNKAAVYFYLAAAYEQLAQPERASGLYITLLEGFNNRNIMLCVFDARTLSSAEMPKYSVSIQEEAALRLARLTKSAADAQVLTIDDLWPALANSKNTFGPEHKPGFLYSDFLADFPELNMSTYVYYNERLPRASGFARHFIALLQTSELAQAAALLEPEARKTPVSLFTRLQEPPDNREAVTLEFNSLWRAENAYFYTFVYNEAGLTLTVKEDAGRFTIEKVAK